jgi:hypothetical protein
MAMDKRAAARQAHLWVAAVIDGALGNGSFDELADEQRVREAIKEISQRHRRLADSKKRATPDRGVARCRQ